MARSIEKCIVASAISYRPSGSKLSLNPAHPDAKSVVVAEIVHAPFDSRLLK